MNGVDGVESLSFYACLDLVEEGKVTWSQVGAVGWLCQYCHVEPDQNFVFDARRVSRHIVVVENPIALDSRADRIPQAVEHSSVKVTYDSLSTRNKLLVYYSFTIKKKTISMYFTRDMFMRDFLGFGDEVVCHSEICHFNSGSYS